MSSVPSLLGLAGLLLVAVSARWLAWRTQLPALVLLAGAGLLLGPALGWFDPHVALGGFHKPTLQLSVALILFEGGLRLPRRELDATGNIVGRLVSVGVLLAAALGALLARTVGGLSWPVSAVLGAILVVTGPTVILPMLSQTALDRRTSQALKWEGIINDPIGALLAVLVFEAALLPTSGAVVRGTAAGLGFALVGAVALGLGSSVFLGGLLRRDWLPEFLVVPATLSSVIAVFAGCDLLQSESGLLGVTVMGIAMRWAAPPRQLEPVLHFMESASVLLVGVVFVVLTAGFEPSALAELSLRHVAMLAGLILLVRPAAVLLASAGGALDLRRRALIAWIGPRGVVAAATAGVFGPELVAAGHTDGALLAPLVFIVVLTTVLLHGLSMAPLARALKLSRGPPEGLILVGASAWTTALAIELSRHTRVLLVDPEVERLQEARDAGVPTWAGEVLSEVAEDELDFTSYADLLAATLNHPYNTLICHRLAHVLGDRRVHQVMAPQGATGTAATISLSGGQFAAFDPVVLQELVRVGWSFTVIDAAAHPVIWLEPDGRVSVVLMDSPTRSRGKAIALRRPEESP